MKKQSECPNWKILRSLESSLDRLNEAAWFIRMMEDHYHEADKFRWSLNSFLRTLKEVIQILTVEMQHNKEMAAWLKTERERLCQEPLLAYLFKQRDIVVHKTMLAPASKGHVGYTRGRGLKFGFGMPIDPMHDSEAAILNYIYFAAKDKDAFGILYTEDDGSGEFTCVQREWRLAEFPDTELIQSAAKAWEKVATVVYEVATRLGASVKEARFDLRDPNEVQFEIYSPKWVKEQLQRAKDDLASRTAETKS